MKARLYRAFGLNIFSEVEMPHWPEAAGAADVHVRWGEVPETLPDATELWGTFQGRRGACLFAYEGIGRILVEEGSRITCEPEKGQNLQALGTVLAGVCSAALLFQRNRVVLHASAAAKDGRAILILGPSGAGKSTTVSALVQRGYQLISDDLTVVSLRPDGTPEALPSFPAVRLHRDSLHALRGGISSGDAFDALDGKQRRRLEEFASEPVAIGRCCRILSHEASSVTSEAVQGVQRLVALQDNVYRRRMARLLADPHLLDSTLMALAQRVELLRIVRPRSSFDLDALCRLITT